MPHPAPEPNLLLLPELALADVEPYAPPWASPSLQVGLASVEAAALEEDLALDLQLSAGLALARATLLQGFAVPQPAPVLLAPPLATSQAEQFLEARTASGTVALEPGLALGQAAGPSPLVEEPLRVLALELALAEGRPRTPLLLLQLVALEPGLALGQAAGSSPLVGPTLRVLSPDLASADVEGLEPEVWSAIAPPLALASSHVLQAHPSPLGDQELFPGLAFARALVHAPVVRVGAGGPRATVRGHFAGRVLLVAPLDRPAASDR